MLTVFFFILDVDKFYSQCDPGEFNFFIPDFFFLIF